VKPAALITRMNPHDRFLPKPAFELTEKKLESASAKKPEAKAKGRKTRTVKGASSKKVAAKTPAPGPKAGVATAPLASQKPEAKKPAKPAPPVANAATPKPSAAIVKQQAKTSPN
jgi:hypothetical protein